MPSWPTQTDYKDALRNPAKALRDPALQRTQAERSAMGLPRARSGAFASVYKLNGPRGAVALKVFNFPNLERGARYVVIAEYLRSLGPQKPASLLSFDYDPQGIQVGKSWYPTFTTEWVPGKI